MERLENAIASRMTRINAAEAVVEPFWDPALSGLKEWQQETAAARGVSVLQEWCKAAFSWQAAAAGEPALRLRRRYELPCAGFDQLIVSAVLPARARLRVALATDRGPRTASCEAPGGGVCELAVALDGSALLLGAELEVTAGEDGPGGGWFNWLLLDNEALLEKHLKQFSRTEADWEDYLQPEDFEPSFEPAFGYAVDPQALARLRGNGGAAGAVADVSSWRFVRRAAAWAGQPPEPRVGEFVNFWDDTRFCRTRDHGRFLVSRAPELAAAGLLTRDKRLLRMSARYALALAACEHWDDGLVCVLPGSTFETRCFVRSLAVYDIAYALDAAGELFTPLGRAYLHRRIAEEGLGKITAITWRHEYIYHCNQLLWFSSGRLLGYAALLPVMPRVRPYMDIAFRDMAESLASCILPDGGFTEGPVYFLWTVKSFALAMSAYARATGSDPATLVPERLRRTADFAEALRSTTDGADWIPVCDAVPPDDWRVYDDALAFLAATLPDSPWPALYRKRTSLNGGRPDSLAAAALEAAIPREAPASDSPSFVALPETGWMASTRRLGGHAVKLLLPGNRAGAGHCHEDKGSFVLEFAGETFAEDPGMCDYGHPLMAELQQCERHNMLVPVAAGERPHPLNPLPADVKPSGSGDEAAFRAEMDLSPGWEPYYRKWRRCWSSETPARLTIRDDYELTAGEAVEFLWQTRLPVRLEPGRAVIAGRRGRVVLTLPGDCRVRVEELPLAEGVIRRIAVRQEGTSGSLTIAAELQPSE